MHRLYLYNDLHNGDLLTNRALVAELLRHSDLMMTLGNFRNRSYIFADLPVMQIVVDRDEPAAGYSLAEACPADFVPVNTWCGCFPDIDRAGYHNWRTIADTFNRQMEQRNIPIRVPRLDAPMLDFRVRNPYHLKSIQRFKIYLENGATRSGHCVYEFDVAQLAADFDDYRFYCTADPRCDASNVVDCSGLNLVQLSLLSNHCDAIIGKGSGPFLTTYTEPNRLKPRAVVGFTAPKFWEYHNNPLLYLQTTLDLYSFLRALEHEDVTWL